MLKRLLGWAAKTLAVLILLFCGLAAWGGARSLFVPAPPLRGEMVDVGGRRLRVVCEGPRSERPLVLLESGIWGFASDWGAVQPRLAARGWRSCAYDRAGLGFSDPGPLPRDGRRVIDDLDAWLKAKGETGPYLLVGHSMAGLHTRLFAARHPEAVRGLVLVDAVSPELARPRSSGFFRAFRGFAKAGDFLARFGVFKPFDGLADQIGLDGPAHDEKRFFFGRVAHNRWAAAEALSAMAAGDQARAARPLDPNIPVAVITEGPREIADSDWGRGRAAAAARSRHGSVENIENATHASLLGRDHAKVIVRAVERVAAAAGVR